MAKFGIFDQITAMLAPHLWKKDEPDSHAPHKYDAQFGFEDNPRPIRLVTATKEEMDSANLEDGVRNYCAHYHMQWRGCIDTNAPFWYKCKGLHNEVKQCYWNELLHDMKEFEREKRLNARERILRESK